MEQLVFLVLCIQDNNKKVFIINFCMNNLKIYQNNSNKIQCEIPNEFINETGATTTFSVHTDEFLTGSTLFQISGSSNLGVVTFNVSAANNDLPIRVYFYDVILTLDNKNYIIAQGSYSIEDGTDINVDTDFIQSISGSSTNYYTKSEVDNLLLHFSGGTSGQTYTFIGSGDTRVVKNGQNITIYTPFYTGSTGSTGGDIYELTSPAAIQVGGIGVGDILIGKTYGQLFESLLVPVLFPSLTNPFNSFSSDAGNLYEIGDTQIINFTSNFNQGSINPAYGTNGKRSGLPWEYFYSGAGLPLSPILSNALSDVQSSINYVIVAGEQSWGSAIAYSAGEQPKDSKGNNYNSPLGGDLTSFATVTIEGVYPVFGTTVLISALTKQSLVSMLTGNNIVLNMVAETGGNKQSFEIATDWLAVRPLVGIQTFNTVSSTWEYQGGSANTSLTYWTVTDVTETIKGNTVNYKKFTYNGTDRSATQIKIILT
jgi:hypothetical protein